MDVEGNERDALRGAENLIDNSCNVDFAICCYHSDFAQVLIEGWMENKGIIHEASHGYMWFPTLLRQTYVST